MTDRVALVTGGSRGIGAEITRQLAARGLRVACTYRTGAAAATELADTLDGMAVHLELGDADSAAEAVAAVLARYGRLDALVLNAGVWEGGKLADLDPAAWWRVVETNVHGTAQVTRAALAALRDGANASVTVISSAVGIIGFPGDTAYAAAKSALFGFARSLAKELGRSGVRVNALAPGFVTTEMTAAIPTSSRDRIAEDVVLHRFGTAEEIAKAAVFLAEDATYCTGTVLTADGGWSL